MKLKKILPLIGIIILIILIKKADVSKIIWGLQSVNYVFLVIPFVIVFIILGLNTWKWSFLLKRQKIEVPFWQLVKFNLIGQFYGVATPARLGNFIRINYLKEYTQKSYSQSSVSVFLDRIIDLLGLLILSLFGILILFQYLPIKVVYIIFGCLSLLLIATFFIVNQKWNKRWLKVIYQKLVPSKYKEPLKSVYYSIYRDFPRRTDIAIVVLVGLLIWIILSTGSYWIIQSINIDISWFHLIGALSISSVVSLLPISISGWGTREATLFILLTPFGISVEQILVFSILNFFFFSIIPAVLGAVFVFKS